MLSDHHQKRLQMLKERMLLHGFTQATIKTYTQAVKQFLYFCEKSSLKPSKEAVKYYLLSLRNEANTVRLYHAALRFFLRKFYDSRFLLKKFL